MLATHYYALFLVAPQALWLLARAAGLRERVAALALPAVAGAALLPLALAQRTNDTAAFITDTPLRTRLAQVPKQFLVGYDAPAETLLTILTALAVLAGLGGLAAMIAGRIAAPATDRSDAVRLAAVTAAASALLLAATVAGEDHLLTRNAIAVLPLVLVLAGAGLAALSRARRATGRRDRRSRVPARPRRDRGRRARPAQAARRLARRRRGARRAARRAADRRAGRGPDPARLLPTGPASSARQPRRWRSRRSTTWR